MKTVWHFSAVAVVTIATAACGGGSTGSSGQTDLSQLPTISAVRRCESLAQMRWGTEVSSLKTGGMLITSATTVEAAPETVGTAAVTRALPRYCKVLADIYPVDPAAGTIRMQVNLPDAWAQKALQVGGGGLNGSIPANLAAVGSSGSPISGAFPPDAPYPLTLGYATYGGDSGHQETGLNATWALNAESWENFGHAALKKTHDAAFHIIEAMYGRTPQLSYFMGQSQGGREAMEVAQRYPADYDGVVATSPLVGYVSHVVHKSLVAQPQAGAGWLPPAKLSLISAEVVRQCDALDGLTDGVIDNYRGCQARFKPSSGTSAWAAVRCAGGMDTGNNCLSDAQLATIDQMHAPLIYGFDIGQGITTAPGYGLGRESQSGWLNVNPQPGLSAQPSLGQPGATLSFGILKDPTLNLLKFTIAASRERLTAAASVIDTNNTNLEPFFQRGGRLIVKSQSSDYSSNPQAVMAYYDRLVAQFGQSRVDSHVRFYVMPNGSHGGDAVSATTGAAQPQYVNLVRLMTDWVEKAQVPPDAPEMQAMLTLPPYTVRAAKPLCRYPLYPRYAGTGDPLSSRSYNCVP